MSAMTEAIRRLVGGNHAAGGTVQALWNDTVIAESDRTIVVEHNHYFPMEDVHAEYLEPSSHSTVCPWKGTASYYDVVVDGKRNPAAAWVYPTPSPAAAELKNHVALWRGVKVRPVDRG